MKKVKYAKYPMYVWKDIVMQAIDGSGKFRIDDGIEIDTTKTSKKELKDLVRAIANDKEFKEVCLKLVDKYFDEKI